MKPLGILVVDDEQGIRDLMRDALSLEGHRVMCAQNGTEAIELLSSNKVDVVFLDIRMPKGDGLTALREIRRLNPALPVVMITGCGKRQVIDEAIQLGCDACLIKPFSMRDVVGMLEVLGFSIARAA
jgi:two-component system response regulator AtoC